MPKVTFVNEGQTVEVPKGTSILEAAKQVHAKMGDACGGNLACSTCHIWVQSGGDTLTAISDAEDDILDKAFDVREESRLGCQCLVAEDDVVVEITEESVKTWYDENPQERAGATG